MATDRYRAHLPARRPKGLRLRTLDASWFRVDGQSPQRWSWEPLVHPRYRFDSAAGTCRVRYFGSSERTCLRERFDDAGRYVDPTALTAHLVRLDGSLSVLDLRTEKVLDALGFDDQISTSRSPVVWARGHELTDRIHAWFGDRIDGIVYRSRTTPERSANLALMRADRVAFVDLGQLRSQSALLATAVLSDGFVVDGRL